MRRIISDTAGRETSSRSAIARLDDLDTVLRQLVHRLGVLLEGRMVFSRLVPHGRHHTPRPDFRCTEFAGAQPSLKAD